MLVTFMCERHEDIIMFGEVGLRLLTMMGYDGKQSGVILVEDIHAAHERLQHAINGDKERSAARSDSKTAVSLEHRAFPLFAMLDAAEKEKSIVKWKTT